MQLTMIKQVFHALALLAFLESAPAHAQDFGNLLRSVVQSRSGDMAGLIKSVADISLGQVTLGARGPADAEGKVVLYSTAWCGYCKRAIAYMQQKNIPFVERNIETSSSNKAEYTRLGGKGPVPFIVFGDKTLQGFSESSFDQNYAEFQRTQTVGKTTPPTSPIPVAPNQAPQPGVIPQAGDTLVGKIAGIKVYSTASKAALPLLVLAKTDEVIYMGEENGGLYRVTTPRGEGWVDKLLVKKY